MKRQRQGWPPNSNRFGAVRQAQGIEQAIEQADRKVHVPSPPADLSREPNAAPRPLDPTALSWWFPKIEAAGLPVPRTRIFKMPLAAQGVVWVGVGEGGEAGSTDTDALTEFTVHVAERVMADGFRFPLFLRTDHGSGKHRWNKTCHVGSHEDLADHMYEIAGWSEMAGVIGLPWDTWVVRELLPTAPLGICPNYEGMPICREFRLFVDDGEFVCTHPYWPERALKEGGARLTPYSLKKLQTFRDHGEMEIVQNLARRVSAAVTGAWSVDILDTDRGWFVTDMAEAHRSWHWPDCPHQARFQTSQLRRPRRG